MLQLNTDMNFLFAFVDVHIHIMLQLLKQREARFLVM